MATINDFAKAIVLETTRAVKIVHEMVAEAEHNAKAEVEAQRHTDCRNCQAGFVNWRIANPTADEAEAETAHHDIWSECPACVAEYAAWNAEADRRAAEHALSSLGDAYMHAINGDDQRWQNGGSK